MPDLAIRAVAPQDMEPLTDLWHAGWIEAHAAHTPAELHALRSRDSFRTRLGLHAAHARTAGPVGAPLGLCIVKGNEVHQLYTAPAARGTGLAAALIADGEARIAAAGHARAWLDVLPQNRRAIAFYEKRGWTRGRVETVPLETLGAPFDLPCLIMTKEF